MKKSQIVVEMFVVLALILSLMVFLIALESNNVTTSVELLRLSQAQASVQELADTVDYLYTQGRGATKYARITLPPNYDPEKSYIGAKEGGGGSIINIRLNFPQGDMDVQERLNAELVGSFPKESGEYRMEVRMEDQYIIIGKPQVAVTPPMIQIIMEPEEEKDLSFILMYSGQENINIKLGKADIVGEAGEWISLPFEGARVRPNSQITISPVRISVPRSADPGLYKTNLVISDGYSGTVPIILEIVRRYEYLKVYPSKWAENISNYTNLKNIHCPQPTEPLTKLERGASFSLCNDRGEERKVRLNATYNETFFYTDGEWTGQYNIGTNQTDLFNHFTLIQPGTCTTFDLTFGLKRSSETQACSFQSVDFVIRQVYNNTSLLPLSFPIKITAYDVQRASTKDYMDLNVTFKN